MELVYNGYHPLTKVQFRILYAIFKAARDPMVTKHVPYGEMPVTLGSLKVHMVAINKILPEGAIDTIPKVGYKWNLSKYKCQVEY
jgi:hypothetical protein